MKLFLALILVSIASFNGYAQKDTSYLAKRDKALIHEINTPKYRGYILQSEMFDMELKNITESNNISFWTPSVSDIKKYEKHIAIYLKSQSHIKPQQKYLRQYFGYTDSTGAKMLLVHFLEFDNEKDPIIENAKKYYIRVNDGLYPELTMIFDTKKKLVLRFAK